MKTFKWVLLMCVALFALWAAVGCALSQPARCSAVRPQRRSSADGGEARLAQPALPGLRFITAAPVY